MSSTTKKPTKNTKFWGIWSQCKKRFQAANMSSEEIEEERQALLKLSGAKADKDGRYSMKSLNNDGFSCALDYMETTILGMPNKKRRSRTKIYAIEKLGLDDIMLNKVAEDIFKVSDWKTLSHQQLIKFQMTAKRIASTRK